VSTTIVGNMTSDPEVRFTAGGMAVCSFGVAENHRKKNKQGQYEDVPSFFDVVCFGDQAEHISETLQKGNRVVIVGQFTQRSWETKDGEKRSKIELVADEVAPSLRFATATVQRKGKGGGTRTAQQYDQRPFTEDDSF
jgi:single-strand DNA-binding protein